MIKYLTEDTDFVRTFIEHNDNFLDHCDEFYLKYCEYERKNGFKTIDKDEFYPLIVILIRFTNAVKIESYQLQARKIAGFKQHKFSDF